ncbi:hydroxyacylglutathione hydrolase [Acinetobacter larvae]|uniref:Hydroxyacylglutathione hydrolase n=1 Tax=Acinetobacter larvae TaxID=1789224 RepID=A0A1B2M1P6_9GAMM|nr:hydroxyacylglutathione hydrolase [Acinetobacter larvae]AOA58943.1 hydroxyacylglutathione hydrolase [Acinetobacter larvae]
MSYKVHVIDVKNALKNYIWLVEHCPSQDVVVIDPTEATLVEDYCQQHHLHISQIWLTHWHKDHVGGAPELLKTRSIAVYGPALEQHKIPFITHPVQQDAQIYFHDLKVDVLSIPGHTLGHIAFYAKGIQSLFCGDTLFAMGCGRIFEGTAQQMYQSLQQLAALPADTLVYCSHEYTLSNAMFAIHLDPDNSALQQRFAQVQQLQQQAQITLPSSIALERATNPFLRVQNSEELAHIRQLKDQF